MPANRLPYFPFHVDDYLNDDAVMRMDADAEGCFIRLLARSWKTSTPGVIAKRLIHEMASMHRITDSMAPMICEMEYAIGEDGPGRWRRDQILDQMSEAFDIQETDEGEVWIQRRMVAEYHKLTSGLQARQRGAEKTNARRSSSRSPRRSPTEEVEVEGEQEESTARELSLSSESKSKNSLTGTYRAADVKMIVSARAHEVEHERIKAQERAAGFGR
jgi:uncharacterized protein YdaU (DUF1376 family)